MLDSELEGKTGNFVNFPTTKYRQRARTLTPNLAPEPATAEEHYSGGGFLTAVLWDVTWAKEVATAQSLGLPHNLCH
jgi:hypothetical protein